MDILQFLEKGGTIVYILIILNIIGFTVIFMELSNLYTFKKNLHITVNELLEKVKNNHEDLLEMLIQQKIKKLEFGLNTIKIIATISPLLGLLGTVLGIFISFDEISKVGLDDPMNFSGGISLALITTIVGLIVSIPHYIFYNYFIGTLDNMEITLKSEVLSQNMKRREPLTLDLTPLIDVVFILIIFFIVSSSFKKENYALNLTLPQGANSAKMVEKKMVTIELSDKDIAYNGEKIDFIQLQEKLEVIVNKEDSITVKIDKSVPYQKVVELLDILQLNNLSNLSLVTSK